MMSLLIPIITVLIVIGLLFVANLAAMPLHPDTNRDKDESGNFEIKYGRGINEPSVLNNLFQASKGNFKLLTILIEFDDNPQSVIPEYFDTLIYGDRFSTVKDYYRTISYNSLDIVTVNLPSQIGWIKAPESYAFYVDSMKGLGDYPNNCQKLCEDIVELIDPFIDFSEYDNDGNGYVDGVILVHSGSGAEYSGNINDIHSHKWSTYGAKYHDGVYVYEYSIQPEYWLSPGDMTCGVYCHELGHLFGLPDLYDTDYSSRGAGQWSLMASGSWNGPLLRGSVPAEPDAWSRIQLGFLEPLEIQGTYSDVLIDPVESNGGISRLTADDNEYFLIENRQKIGYDTYLPGDGLLIWHIDSVIANQHAPNNSEWYPGHEFDGHYGVALEQADALFQLEQYQNSGDSGDPYPGSSNYMNFISVTTPSSDKYNGDESGVEVRNIRVKENHVIEADLTASPMVDVTEPQDTQLPEEFVLFKNYPNPFNPTTTIEFALPEASDVSLTVYDILGRRVETLVGEHLEAGSHSAIFDASSVASGVYFYRIEAGDFTKSRKMTLLK